MPNQDMLINYVPGEECRIALVEDGKLEELYTERESDDIHVGNIYRGRITNVEPSIQAAFVDFGLERNGFLHISDLHPRYFGSGEDTERVGKRTPRRDRPPIQKCLKRGQEILVQVLKEGIGTKGPTLTSYLSIPGRFLVMMPDMERLGVSRKIEDDELRREMRKTLDTLDPPEGFGFIIRTAGIGRTKTELKRDLAFLQRLWKTLDKRLKSGRGPVELYREADLVIRTLRDVMSSDIKRIIIDDPAAARRAADFLSIAMPRGGVEVIYYHRPVPLFDAFGIEQQIATINSRSVPLPSGGSLVIDSTEALVAIDVNSGKFRDKGDAESTAFHTNEEAVDEICRQLRLRDLGGVVVLDLIDMYQHKHRREIERRLRDCLKKDRARSKVLRINDLGLVSMTRQRMRPSLKRSLHQTCTTCEGTGVLKTTESVVLDVMRQLGVVLSSERVHRAELTIHHSVGAMLLNRRRQALHQLENSLGKHVEIKLDAEIGEDTVRLRAFDDRKVELDLDKLPQPKTPKFTKDDLIGNYVEPEPVEEEPAEEEVPQVPEASAEPTDPLAEGLLDEEDTEGGTKKKRRRRRRGGRRHRKRRDGERSESTDQPGEGGESGESGEGESEPPSEAPTEPVTESGETESSSEEEGGPTKKRRRRRRGGRRHRKSRGENAGSTEGGSSEPGEVNGNVAAPPEEFPPDPPPPMDDPKPSEPLVDPPMPESNVAPKKVTKKKTTKKKVTKKKVTKKKVTKKKVTKKKTTKKKTTKAKATEPAAETADAS